MVCVSFLESISSMGWWTEKITVYVKENSLKPSSQKRYETSAKQLLQMANFDHHRVVEMCHLLGNQPYRYAKSRPVGLGGLEPLKSIIKNIGMKELQIGTPLPSTIQQGTPFEQAKKASEPESIVDVPEPESVSEPLMVRSLVFGFDFQCLEETLSRIDIFEQTGLFTPCLEDTLSISSPISRMRGGPVVEDVVMEEND